MPAKNMIGFRSGRLVVESRAGSSKTGQARWLCRCECGKAAIVFGSNLRQQTTKSCGCIRADGLRTINFQHGFSRGRRADGSRRPDHYLYETWCGIRRRCLREHDQAYPKYGGRGIGVHKPWIGDFARFKDDLLAEIGDRPSRKHSLDRIDNDGNYCPGNLRWATPKMQNDNKGILAAENKELRAKISELETQLAALPELIAEVRRLRKAMADHAAEITGD